MQNEFLLQKEAVQKQQAKYFQKRTPKDGNIQQPKQLCYCTHDVTCESKDTILGDAEFYGSYNFKSNFYTNKTKSLQSA